MSRIVKLDSYLVNGPRVEAVQASIPFGDTTVLMHRPFIEIANGLAITPVIDLPVINPDGSSGIRIRLDLWSPMYLGVGGGQPVIVPVNAPQDQAVAALRAFDADPAITWSASQGELLAWAETFVAALNAKAGERA